MATYSEMLLGDLRAGAGRFNRFLYVSLLFAVACHFCIVEPYFRDRSEETRIKAEMDARTRTIADLEEEREKLEPLVKSASAMLENIRERIAGFPAHLRDRLSEIHDATVVRTQHGLPITPSHLPDRPFQLGGASGVLPRPQDPVAPDLYGQTAPLPRLTNASIGNYDMPSSVTNLKEGANWYVGEWFGTLKTDVDEGIVKALSQATSRGNGPDLHEQLEAASNELERSLASVDPDFWRSYDRGKVPVADELARIMKDRFDPIELSVSDMLEEIRDRLSREAEEVKRLEQERAAQTQRRQAIEIRLKSLESPLGALPLGVADLIAVLPVLLVGVIATLAVMLRRIGLQRAALDRECRAAAQPPDGALVHLCSGCWFLPPHRHGALLLLAAPLLALSAVSMRSAWLVVLGRPGAVIDPADLDVLPRDWIRLVYAVAAPALLISLFSLSQTILRARRSAAPPPRQQ